MSQTVITSAFEQLKAQQAANGGVVILDEFVFANVPDLNINDPIDRGEGLPDAALIVHRQAVGKTGMVNNNAVVYSVVMGADVGDFEFNWVGLVSKANNLVAMIVHAPTQKKIKTAAGQQGNVLTRSFLMEYNGASQQTQIITPADTWQIDFTARLNGVDERIRIENRDIYGQGAFKGEGFRVDKVNGRYTVNKGIAYVEGIRAELIFDQIVSVDQNQTKIWVDVSWSGSLTSVWNASVKITEAKNLSHYFEGDTQHFVYPIAEINEKGECLDLRALFFENDKGMLGELKSKQPLHPTLTAISLLKSEKNKLPYFTGENEVELSDFSDVGRSIVASKTADDALSHLGNKTIYFENILTLSLSVYDAFILAAASGITVVFPSNSVYELHGNDIAVASGTKFVSDGGGYTKINITSTSGQFGTFDLRVSNGIGGGKHNTFKNLAFRYPNQKNDLSLGQEPDIYPALFHGGAYESRFEDLDIGNAYIGFRLGGVLNGIELGSASRITLKNIIGSPLYRGVSLEQVRDVPVIDNIRFNYNYLDATELAYTPKLKQWMHDKGVAFHFGRIDWGVVRNIFSYGYFKHIWLRSTRYTGSADRLKFVGSFCDHTVFPLHAEDFSNQIDFIASGFTGDYNSGFSQVSPSKISINNIGDHNAWVNFHSCTLNNFVSDAITTGSNIKLVSSRVYEFGKDSQGDRIRSGVEVLNDNVDVYIDDSIIDASGAIATRCIYDGGHNDCRLIITGGSLLIGATVDIFRWNGGVSNRETVSDDCHLIGNSDAVSCRGLLGFYRHSSTLQGPRIPSVGTFYRGDYIKNTTPLLKNDGGTEFVVKGWIRLTTGEDNILGVDWLEEKIFIRGNQ